MTTERTEERRNRFSGESVMLTKEEAKKHDAIFIGYAPNSLVKEMVVNPPLDATLNPGDTLFYIAERRINSINWSSLDAD
jgi:hypothetical protein